MPSYHILDHKHMSIKISFLFSSMVLIFYMLKIDVEIYCEFVSGRLIFSMNFDRNIKIRLNSFI